MRDGVKRKSDSRARKIKTYQTRVVPIDSVAPHPRNTEYHSHPDAQVDMLAQSAQTFGQYKNIVVWKKQIIAGAGIWAGLKRAGATEIEIKDVSHLSQAQAFALMTADNETQKGAITNDAALAALVREVMDAEGEALARLAAGEQKALDALLAQTNENDGNADAEPKTDKAEELQKQWKTASGQTWIIGNHRLLIGDCTLKENIERLTKGEPIPLMLTDPPYGINVVDVKNSKNFRAAVGGAKPATFGTDSAKGAYAFGGIKSARATIGARGKVDATLYRPVHGDDKPFDPSHLFGLAKRSILFGANYYSSKLPDSRHWIVWDKNMTGTFADAELAWSDFETGVKLYKHTWNGMQREGERRLESKTRIHPNQKPVGLLSEILKDHSDAGDIILDLYAGSGSVMVACENTQRTCFAMEIDAAYGAVILQRMRDAFPQIKIELLGLTPRRVTDAGQKRNGKQAKRVKAQNN